MSVSFRLTMKLPFADSKTYVNFLSDVARELAIRLLREVIPRTPIGRPPHESGYVISPTRYYLARWGGYKGGSLREAWTKGNTNVSAYVRSLPIRRNKTGVSITLKNDKEYASYVEVGHAQHVGRYVAAIQKKLVKPWVEGSHMLQISEQILKSKSRGIIQAELDRQLKAMFK